MRIGRISHFLLPGYGWCGKCYTNWGFVKGHTTHYNKWEGAKYEDGSQAYHSGVFALCEKCWKELTPEKRLPYYERLFKEWIKQGSPKTLEEWEDIKESVLAGL